MAKKTSKKPKNTAPKPKQERLLDDMPKVPALDRLCAKLSLVRESKNDLATEEKGLIQDALRRMKDANVVTYKAHGVELVRVQGDEKVRVRLVDDDNGGAADGEDSGDAE